MSLLSFFNCISNTFYCAVYYIVAYMLENIFLYFPFIILSQLKFKTIIITFVYHIISTPCNGRNNNIMVAIKNSDTWINYSFHKFRFFISYLYRRYKTEKTGICLVFIIYIKLRSLSSSFRFVIISD